ncbi:hypothetical protein Tco_0762517 [Tanacetum coccineum]
MDSMIPTGQKNTLAEYMILSGADNRPPMLEKDLYDSWKSIMEPYMTKKYAELSPAEKIQADYDMKTINIILQGTSLTKQERECKMYDAFDKFAHIKGESLHQYYLRFTQQINDMNIYNMKLEQFQVNTKFLNTHLNGIHLAEFLQIDFGLEVLVFKQGDIDAINKMMSFLSNVVTSRFPSTNNQLRNSSNPRQQATIHDGRVTIQPLQERQNSYAAGECHMARQCPKPKRKRDATWFREKVLLVKAQGNGKVLTEEELEFLADPGIAEGPITQSVITHNATYQADDFDAYDSDCDEIYTAKAVFIAYFSSYRSDVIYEVPISNNTNNDMLNQSVQEMPYSEPSHFVEHSETEIHSDSNIIPYSQYLIESQTTAVHDTNSSAQQDALILSVFEQLYKEQTLMLEEESRSKMLLKQSDPMVLEKKVNTTPINYAELNRLSGDFYKSFAPRELPKYHVDKQGFEIQKKHFLIENDRLLDQIISQDIVNIFVNSSVDVNTSMKVNSYFIMNDYVNYMEMCNKCLELEAELLKQHNMVEKDEYNRLFKRYSELEQHCISLEIAMQLNKEIFQKTNTSVNQTEPSFGQLFESNNLKAELQAKDMIIKKLKAHIKHINETSTSEKKVFVVTAFKNDLRKLKGKDIVATAAQMSNAATIALEMYKLDPVILAPMVKNNREAHEYYLKHTIEQAAILREVVEQAKSQNPLDSASYSACMHCPIEDTMARATHHPPPTIIQIVDIQQALQHASKIAENLSPVDLSSLSLALTRAFSSLTQATASACGLNCAVALSIAVCSASS